MSLSKPTLSLIFAVVVPIKSGDIQIITLEKKQQKREFVVNPIHDVSFFAILEDGGKDVPAMNETHVQFSSDC